MPLLEPSLPGKSPRKTRALEDTANHIHFLRYVCISMVGRQRAHHPSPRLPYSAPSVSQNFRVIKHHLKGGEGGERKGRGGERRGEREGEVKTC